MVPSETDPSALGVSEARPHRVKLATPASWRPGAPSPNPSGRPKKTETERQAEALAKEKAPAAMRKLVSMIESSRTTEAGRLRAIELLLDRALGKPVARGEMTPEFTITVQSFAGVPPMPIPGVLSHPNPAFVQVNPGLRLVTPVEVIEADATTTLEGST